MKLHKLMKRALVYFVLLALCFAYLPADIPAYAAGNTILVGPAGTSGVDYNTIEEALLNVSNGDTIQVLTGDYNIVPGILNGLGNAAYHTDWSGQVGNLGGTNNFAWYLPITKSVTIEGVKSVNGTITPITDPNDVAGMPRIYSTYDQPNGVLCTQDLITVFADGVTLKGLHIQHKIEPNKSVDVGANNFTMQYCYLDPLSAEELNVNGANYADDYASYGGSLFFDGSLNPALSPRNQLTGMVVTNNCFIKSGITLNSAAGNSTFDISNNTFTGNRIAGTSLYSSISVSASYAADHDLSGTDINLTGNIYNSCDGPITTKYAAKTGGIIDLTGSSGYKVSNGGNFVVNIDPNGGTAYDSASPYTTAANQKRTYVTIAGPDGSAVVPAVDVRRPGFTLVGYSIAGNDSEAAQPLPSSVTQDTTFVAQWAADTTPSDPNDGTGGGNEGTNGSNTTDETTTTTDSSVIIDDGQIPLGGAGDRLTKPYIFGYTDGRVGPEHSLSRAQAAQIVYNLYGDKVKTANDPGFKDLKNSYWGYDAIAYCASRGIVVGYPNGTFKPEQPVTRAECAAIFARLHDLTSNVDASFTDIKDSWAKQYINALYAAQVISDSDNRLFRPNDPIKRAEACVIVNKSEGRNVNGTIMTKTFPDLKSDFWGYMDMMNAINGSNRDR